MKTEHWALLISFLALISSIALPMWFRNKDNKEKRANMRSLLLQKILSVRSQLLTCRLQLIYLFRNQHDKMDIKLQEALKSKLSRIIMYDSELSKICDECSNCIDDLTSMEIEKIIAKGSVIESEISDVTKLIEEIPKLYE